MDEKFRHFNFRNLIAQRANEIDTWHLQYLDTIFPYIPWGLSGFKNLKWNKHVGNS